MEVEEESGEQEEEEEEEEEAGKENEEKEVEVRDLETSSRRMDTCSSSSQSFPLERGGRCQVSGGQVVR